ncbi:helix-turn-helix domain-containing protein [Sphingobium nicotianae]|uniref:Helix-turn-helix domain-containing protein n=1 Tax=Sphingobium nicotianae TaxID=2782607 RepID=A0A9X1DE44_9SPHN|nr:helix-turn-helix domain-containing protein [Sphingobium nicotianae]MBT2188226.1 helix-turn-helix domain-containing protein [Sphingobium nicotianae]
MSTQLDWPAFRERGDRRSNLFSLKIESAEVRQEGCRRDELGISVDDLGPIRFIHLRSGAIGIRRTEGDINDGDERCFTFLLQIEGTGDFQQYGNQIMLEPGDLSLCDNGAPYSYTADADCAVIMLRVPNTVMRESLPSPHECCGRRLGIGQDLVSTAGAMARSLLEQLRLGLSDECRQRAAQHLLAIISSCYVASFDRLGSRSSVMTGRHWRVRSFIEQNLRDPELSPAMIAAHLKLSSRYLRMIFAANNESISAYVLRRRLEECAARLTDPRWAGHSITEIAFSWGFNSAPHFTRSFREHFDMSPRDYRQRSINSSGGQLANRRRGDKVSGEKMLAVAA